MLALLNYMWDINVPQTFVQHELVINKYTVLT